MGVYSYGSDITEPENRAQRFAGFDGTEICGLIIGTLASAPIYTHGGFYARYKKKIFMRIFTGAKKIRHADASIW